MEPFLPVEIQNHIISLVGTRPDVLKCALVCKAWLVRSRPISFATCVKLLSRTDANEDTITELLRHPLSTLPTFLLRLSIELRVTGSLSALAAFAERKVAIQELQLNFHHRTVSQPLRSTLLHFISTISTSLRKLTLDGCAVQDGPSLLQAASQALLLTDLSFLPDIELQNLPLPESVAGTSPPSLRFLETKSMDPAFLEGWGRFASHISVQPRNLAGMESLANFLSSPTTEHIRKLDLRINFLHGGTNPLERFLLSPHLASFLSSVRMILMCCPPETMDQDFRYCTNLHSLSLSIFLNAKLEDDSVPASVFRSLSTIPAATVSGLTLHLTLMVSMEEDKVTTIAAQMDHMIEDYAQRMVNANVLSVTLDRTMSSALTMAQFPKCVAWSLASQNFTFDVTSSR